MTESEKHDFGMDAFMADHFGQADQPEDAALVEERVRQHLAHLDAQGEHAEDFNRTKIRHLHFLIDQEDGVLEV